MRRRTQLLTGVLILALVSGGVIGAVGATTLAPAVDGGELIPGAEGAATDGGTAAATAETATGSAAGAPLVQQEPTCNYQSLYDQAIGSVVTIQVRTPRGGGLGSGFVYDDSGRIVTNQHVVANATAVEVQFNQGQWRTAEVVGTDAYSDLAVLDVDNVPNYADPLALNASGPQPGQPVAALGSPLGLQGTITGGIVSAVNRSLPAGGATGPQFTIPNTVQTTAAINPGNSGGPLMNCRGQVIGVNTAGAQGSDNIGFAVPASRVQRVAPALIQDGTYNHSFLGITSTDVTPTVAQANDLQVTRGVLVGQVVPGSPADGVLQGSTRTAEVNGQPVPVGGDVILRVAGQRIGSQEDLASVLVQKRPGETVQMTILRDGERQRVTVTLGIRPDSGS